MQRDKLQLNIKKIHESIQLEGKFLSLSFFMAYKDIPEIVKEYAKSLNYPLWKFIALLYFCLPVDDEWYPVVAWTKRTQGTGVLFPPELGQVFDQQVKSSGVNVVLHQISIVAQEFNNNFILQHTQARAKGGGILQYDYDAVYTGKEFTDENGELGVQLGMHPKMKVPVLLRPFVDSKLVVRMLLNQQKRLFEWIKSLDQESLDRFIAKYTVEA